MEQRELRIVIQAKKKKKENKFRVSGFISRTDDEMGLVSALFYLKMKIETADEEDLLKCVKKEIEDRLKFLSNFRKEKK